MGHLTHQFDQHWFHEFSNRCLIFNCYNISICKKEKIKDETSKKIRETNGGQWDILLLNLTSIGFTNFFRCFIFDFFFFTNADVVTIKDETLKKIRETDAGQIKEQDVPLT